jgi:hypothetical protein
LKPVIIAILFLGVGILTGLFMNVSAEEQLIPSWIKNTARFWVDGQVSDKEFLSALQYLVKQGILIIPTAEDTASSPIEKTTNKQVIGGTPLSGLLPTREDVGTEWRIIEFEIDKKLESASEQMARRYIEGSGSPTTIITLYLYGFGSNDAAFSAYDSKVKEIYEKGGYKEYNVGSVGADKCYGSIRTYDQGDKGEVYCYKNNVYYIVDFRTIFSSIEKQPKNFASKLASGIDG